MPAPQSNEEVTLETVMRRAALEAGALIMQVYARADLGVRAKADDSPVTEADEAADAHIAAALAAAFPDTLIVTEENAATHGQSAARFFIVDPLDGTREFVQRRGDFTVNIALVEHGVPMRGVVYAPARRRLFYTRADGMAVEETGPHDPAQVGPLVPLSVRVPDNAALGVVASKSHRTPETDAFLEQVAVGGLVSAGSSLKFCLLAAGEADLYPRLGPTMEWDTAAGHAVLAATGGAVLDFATREPLRYGKPGYRNPFFIAHVPGVVLPGPGA